MPCVKSRAATARRSIYLYVNHPVASTLHYRISVTTESIFLIGLIDSLDLNYTYTENVYIFVFSYYNYSV